MIPWHPFIQRRGQMTREEILAMEPGRELDKLVAEKVFNWRKVPGPKTGYNGPCESFDVLVPPTIADPFSLYPPKGVIKPWYFCEYWSTDITAAWKVVEKMRDWGGCEIGCYGTGNKRWFVVSTFQATKKSVSHQINVTAKTAQEAICKAALLAVLEEEKP